MNAYNRGVLPRMVDVPRKRWELVSGRFPPPQAIQGYLVQIDMETRTYLTVAKGETFFRVRADLLKE